MVANMAFSVKHPQHAASKEGAAPNPHRYAWLLKSDRVCKEDGIHAMIPSLDESSSNSWEARAFAEDASSLAAGIWPPRAYPCSFCRREFRSAQALGGHMNVHRRDRACLCHSSPPPPPLFHATNNIPFHPNSTIIQESQQEYSSTTGPNSAACPRIYPNESFSKSSMLQTALPLSTISPKSSTSSLVARYPPDMAASFPLRLHLLASEAASTLMLPQGKSSDPLSQLWPASARDSRNACTGIKRSAIDGSSWSKVSSSSSSSVLRCPVSPSRGATPCRGARNSVAINEVEDESPRKKSNVTCCSDFQLYPVMLKLKNSSKDEETSHAHDKQIVDIVDKSDESINIQRGREGCNEFVDLELRLGQRPP